LLLAFHIGLGVPSGAVALGTSGFLATRKYRAVMTGRPAHAGQAPEQGRNALVAACQAVLGLHTLAQSSAPGVRVNVGTLRAGSALNVVAHHAEFGFELRAERQATLDELTLRALTLLDGIAAAHDIAVETLLCGEATDWANPTELTEWAHNVAVAGGIFAQHRLQHGFGASDDATLMMQAVAGQGGHAAYFVFGADLTSGHHTPTFDFDENVLVDGTALLTALAGTMLAGGVELRSTGQPVPT
jgi:aminobenzoyl-glutamate utilization protein A